MECRVRNVGKGFRLRPIFNRPTGVPNNSSERFRSPRLVERMLLCTTRLENLRSLRRNVGQVGNLRPIVNRPAEGKRLAYTWFQAGRLVAALLLCGAAWQAARRCQRRRPIVNERRGRLTLGRTFQPATNADATMVKEMVRDGIYYALALTAGG